MEIVDEAKGILENTVKLFAKINVMVIIILKLICSSDCREKEKVEEGRERHEG